MNVALEATWRVAAASAAGSAHLEQGLPGQDAYAWRVLTGGELLAAVADGAGSAERSREGAQQAAKSAVAGLEALCRGRLPDDETGWRAAIAGLFAGIQQELVACAAAQGERLQAFDTTLTCALVTANWLVVGQIGDGAAVANCAASADNPDEAVRLAVRPQRQVYANETNFLTRPEVADCMEVYVLRRRVQALALTTDGLVRLALKLPGFEPHPGFYRPLWAFAGEASDMAQAEADLAAFLASERVCARTEDDKTLLLAIRSGLLDERTVRRRGRRRKDVGI